MPKNKYGLLQTPSRVADYKGTIGAIAGVEYIHDGVPYFVFSMPKPIVFPEPRTDYVFYLSLLDFGAQAAVSVVSAAYVSQQILELGLIPGADMKVAWVQAIRRDRQD